MFVRGTTDGGRNFESTEVPEVESGLEKRCPHLVGIENGRNTTISSKINKNVTNNTALVRFKSFLIEQKEMLSHIRTHESICIVTRKRNLSKSLWKI